ncbi:MAG: arginase family protein [Ardenticatenales bacterium]|nr:arginase family protein [Ardenticatenales bacterium]
MTQPGLSLLVGAPLDCSGRFTGVERMPAALRNAGLVTSLGLPDLGDWPVQIANAQRDPASGIIGYADVCASSAVIRQELGELLARGERPLIVGGCCTLLIGVFAALRDQGTEIALAFIDGHLDFYDGGSSPTGEAADMELAILCGLGPAGLTHLAGPPPLVDPANVVVLGHRDAAEAAADGAPDPATLFPAMALHNADSVRAHGAATLGQAVANRFAERAQPFWLHLDLDVLDETALPAVDYLRPGGLSWAETAALTRPLLHSPHLRGADITIYNPALDPDGRYARQIVSFLAELWQPL